MEKFETNNWAIALIGILIMGVIFIAVFGTSSPLLITQLVEDILIVELAIVVAFLYLLGAMFLLFGSILVVSRYIKAKLRSPYRPFGTPPRVTFLTLGLEIFIGAEIINTATKRTMDDFLLLSLTILTRGLIGLILYLERKWESQEMNSNNVNKTE